MDDPTCHACASFEPGRSRCGRDGRPVDPARHLCRDHSSGLYAHLRAGRLYRLEATLIGVEFVPERRAAAAARAPRPFFCARCRAGATLPADPAAALLCAVALAADGALPAALLDDGRLEAAARSRALPAAPADLLAGLLRDGPPAGARFAVCPRCRARLAPFAAAPPEDPGAALVRLVAALAGA